MFTTSTFVGNHPYFSSSTLNDFFDACYNCSQSHYYRIHLWLVSSKHLGHISVFILGLLGGKFPTPKISDSPPKVVYTTSIWSSYTTSVWSAYTTSVWSSYTTSVWSSLFVTKMLSDAKFSTEFSTDDPSFFFSLLFNSSWAGQLNILVSGHPLHSWFPSKGEILE